MRLALGEKRLGSVAPFNSRVANRDRGETRLAPLSDRP